MVDLRTDTAADFVADLASDYSANEGSDERAKSTTHRACNHANGSACCSSLHGCGHTSDRSSDTTHSLAQLLGGSFGANME